MKCGKCGQEYEGNYCPNGCNAPMPVMPPVKQGAPTWAIVLLLVFFFPVGLGLMWAKKSWKTWVKVLITVFFAVLVLWQVGSNADTEPIKEPTLSSAPTSEEVSTDRTTFGLHETAAFRTIRVTAQELQESFGKSFYEAEDGKVFVGVKFTIENISEEDQSISSILLFDAYVDGVKCDYSFSAACSFSDGTLDGTITPGKKLVGWYAVEVPESWKELELQVRSNWLSNKRAEFVFTK